MLTYRTGIGGDGRGKPMSDYLFQPTLDAASLERANYYAQAMPAPSEAERHEAALAQMVVADELTRGEAVREMVRHATREPPTDQAVALGRLVDAGHMPYSDAVSILYREESQTLDDPDDAQDAAFRRLDAALGDLQRMELRFAQAMDRAVARAQAPDEHATLAEPRRNMDPELAALLRLAPHQAPTREEVAHLLNGRTATGEKVEGKVYAKERTWHDKRIDKEKTAHPIGFIDLTFGAPKSVSLAWAGAAGAGLHAEAAMIRQAHRDAVDETMLHVEKTIGLAKRGKGGSHGAEHGAIAWLAFDHFTARPTKDGVNEDREVRGDMHLHTHVAVPNVVRTPDGHVGSLFLQKMAGQTKELGAIYQATLARNLRKLGVEVVLDERTLAARISAVPERVTQHFSRRTNIGTSAAMAEVGEGWEALSAAEKVARRKGAVQDNRLKKQDGRNDLEAWQNDAKSIGYTYRSILRPDTPPPELARDQRLGLAYETAIKLLERELETRAVIGGEDVRLAAARGLIAAGIEGPQDVDALVRIVAKHGVLQAGENTAIFWGTQTDQFGMERVKVSTELHEKWEGEFIKLAKAAAADKSGALSKAQINAAIAWAETQGIRLDTEHGKQQRAAIDALGQGGRLGVMIGAAGVGKTDGVLKPLIHAWQQDGRKVFGIALAWRQTEDFAKAGVTDADRKPISEFIRLAKAGRLDLAGSVVAIDEVAQVGTRSMLEILRLQAEHGFTVKAFGDPKQMQSIEAGPVVRLFQRALGTDAIPEISQTIRQQSVRDREIVTHLRNGEAAQALRMIREDGSAIIAPKGYADAVAHIAALWKERLDANAADPSYKLTVAVPTNADALAVGHAIRELRKASGEVGGEERVFQAQGQAGRGTEPYELRIAVGDKVRLFNQVNGAVDGSESWRARTLGVNGTVLEVTGFTANGVRLRRSDKEIEGAVKWDTLRDPDTGLIRLTYGYAQVIHPMQGVTSTENIYGAPAGTQAIDGFSGYTGLSRHTQRTFLVTSEYAERQQIARTQPHGSPAIRTEDLYDNMARNLSRQPEKAASLDLREQANDLRRGSVAGMQRGRQPLEQRVHEGKEATTLHHRIEQGRAARRMAQMPSAVRSLAHRSRPSVARLARAVPQAIEAVSLRFDLGLHRRSGPRLGR